MELAVKVLLTVVAPMTYKVLPKVVAPATFSVPAMVTLGKDVVAVVDVTVSVSVIRPPVILAPAAEIVRPFPIADAPEMIASPVTCNGAPVPPDNRRPPLSVVVPVADKLPVMLAPPAVTVRPFATLSDP